MDTVSWQENGVHKLFSIEKCLHHLQTRIETVKHVYFDVRVTRVQEHPSSPNFEHNIFFSFFVEWDGSQLKIPICILFIYGSAFDRSISQTYCYCDDDKFNRPGGTNDCSELESDFGNRIKQEKKTRLICVFYLKDPYDAAAVWALCRLMSMKNPSRSVPKPICH